MKQIVDRAIRAPRPDLEAVEAAIRAAALAAGARALEGFLTAIGCGRREEEVVCSCGTRMGSHGVDSKDLDTTMGLARYGRSAFECPRCHRRRYPGDELLDVVHTSFSPGLRRMMARAGSRDTFKEGRDDLRIYAGVTVSAKSVERVAEAIGEDLERWAKRERDALRRQEAPECPLRTTPVMYIELDGTGVPMAPWELEGRQGKQPDGSAKTREAKLGCVFTQTRLDDEGRPLRDPSSTSWVGAIETAAEFGWRLYAESVRRGLFFAERVVALGDGAEWIQNLVQMHFPMARFIIDLYHAKEHVARLATLLFDRNPKQAASWRDRWWDVLEQGEVETLIQQARDIGPRCPCQDIQRELHYLEKNTERMRYAQYRAQGFFVGSGVVEAGCGSVIGDRMKKSGMEWSVRGANAILSLRCMSLSNRVEDYWADRAAG